jgi:hypothetical protein
MVIAMVHMDPANLSQISICMYMYYVHTCEFISQREVSEVIAIDITVGGKGISLTAPQLRTYTLFYRFLNSCNCTVKFDIVDMSPLFLCPIPHGLTLK